jgi:hypothetical protein
VWSGRARTRSIALWSGVGGAIASFGLLVAGALLDHFWWGPVFLITEDLLARCHEEDTAFGAGAASLADTSPTGSAG